MRLTLRTLLSYLDDTLEPSQAKLIGAKVAESEQARELIERIKQVTRRRRLTTPPTAGPGGIDPNTIAEYLDNEVTPEKAAEVEQICLASDVHLAEVAACHQILTLVLGEPAVVPAAAKQRMYALIKGPESIHAHKPKSSAKPELDLSSEIEPDQDETLRLGVPAFGKGNSRNTWILAGGGTLAACLLVFALYQLFHTQPTNVVEPKNDLAMVEPKDTPKPHPPKPVGNDRTQAEKKQKEAPPPPVGVDKDFPPIVVKELKNPPNTVIQPPLVPEIPYEKASVKQMPIGKYVAHREDPGVLLQLKADKSGWMPVLKIRNDTVYSGRPLMSLAGSKLAVALDFGVELTLWGNLPVVTLDQFHLESRAVVNWTDQMNADVTVQRGRILIKNTMPGGKNANVRVRFENPNEPKEELREVHLDIVLQGPGATVAIERLCRLEREPFYPNPKDPARDGPTAFVNVFGYAGTASVRYGERGFTIDEKNQPHLVWLSRVGKLDVPKELVLPDWFTHKGVAKIPDNPKEQKTREYELRAYDMLTKLLEAKQVSVALDEMLQNVEKDAKREMLTRKEKMPEYATYIAWRHALRAKMALDDISYLFGAFADEATLPIMRDVYMQMLQMWIGLERDHDYQLLDMLRKRPFSYKEIASIKIVELFHLMSETDVQTPAKYTQLIEGLDNEIYPIRFLSSWHLYGLAPAGHNIKYDPASPREERARAVRAWYELIPPGRLPPQTPPMPPMKK